MFQVYVIIKPCFQMRYQTPLQYGAAGNNGGGGRGAPFTNPQYIQQQQNIGGTMNSSVGGVYPNPHHIQYHHQQAYHHNAAGLLYFLSLFSHLAEQRTLRSFS